MAGQASKPPSLPKAQTFSFSSTQPDRREAQRNYVFVDEQNRHRRLKVVRACDGCRRRKIRCDAANTSSWPCSACVRLKMTCVPPALNFDDQEVQEINNRGKEETFNGKPRHKTDDDFNYSYTSPQYSIESDYSPEPGLGLSESRSNDFPLESFGGQGNYRVDNFSYNRFATPPESSHNLYQSSHSYQAISSVGIGSPSASEITQPSDEADAEITSALGDLKISQVGVAPYTTAQKATQEPPALQEYEFPLPQEVSSDLTVRIPSEMMPSEAQAMEYFQYYFTNVHPYIPVINRPHFYQQWNHERHMISPLILEGIFACSSLMMNQETEGNQWVALAAKHEESFKDVPRLSTIQGLLILMKARESVPKRGYYYRSWMTVVNLVAMAKDLELDQHFEIHRYQNACGSSTAECVAKTRVWHSLFMLELMVGGAQGRSDFGTRKETIDFDCSVSTPGLDEQELQVSYEFTQLLRVIKNVRQSIELYASLRNKKADWAMDQEFLQHNEDFDRWAQGLPQNMQISYPSDGSPPWILSHFIANMHSYNNLAIIMHYRPQLQVMSESFDGEWRDKMIICYGAAKRLCQLQEALIQNYGITGLLYMQRGVNFVIYSVLTCTMLHLVALTSPDPELNYQAADYFSRHMRILEQCSRLWPMPEMQLQIDSLRQAFSADITKPFTLKPSFPYGSPGASDKSSPPGSDMDYPSTTPDYAFAFNSTSNRPKYGIAAITPPTSTPDPTRYASEMSVPRSTGNVGTPQSQITSMPQNLAMPQQQPSWNPSRIINQWNTAFEIPRATMQASQSVSPPPQPPPPPLQEQPSYQQPSSFPGNDYMTSTTPEHVPYYGSTWSHQRSPPLQQQQQQPPPPPPQTPQQQQSQQTPNFTQFAANYVTPSMWQDAVASSYEGLKRKWPAASAPDDMGFGFKRTR